MIPTKTTSVIAYLADDEYDDQFDAYEALRHVERATAFMVYIPGTDKYRIGWLPDLEEE